MNLQTTRRARTTKAGGKITTLLERFGVEIPKGRKQNFWQKNSGELEYIFYDAKRGYLDAIKKAHPDNGGSEIAARVINRDWAQIKRIFHIYCPKAME